MLMMRELSVSANNKDIIKGLSLDIAQGEVCAIMGPNGSGKSTLAHALAGHQDYQVSGEVVFKSQDLFSLEPYERAQQGLFVAFQYPVAIPGVNNLFFMKTILNAKRQRQGLDPLDATDFMALVEEKAKLVGLDERFWERSLNEDFSGGERKRNDILQMLLLEPDLMILDETDSGLDIDSMQLVANAVNTLRSPKRSIVMITHYQRLLHHIKPDKVHVLMDGKVAVSSDASFVEKLESEGYHWLQETT
ncbi:MAG: Fe-S cluster assembly ATPase SufC [Pseudomonadota bacterium]|nr:Fe-S cluster assembly ATPase SufC [Pseudomonadota bacterium]